MIELPTYFLHLFPQDTLEIFATSGCFVDCWAPSISIQRTRELSQPKPDHWDCQEPVHSTFQGQRAGWGAQLVFKCQKLWDNDLTEPRLSKWSSRMFGPDFLKSVHLCMISSTHLPELGTHLPERCNEVWKLMSGVNTVRYQWGGCVKDFTLILSFP